MKYVLALCCLIPTLLFATTPDSTIFSNNTSVKVDSISIVGNDITEPDIILRELTFSEGDYIDSTLLVYNKERIFSLNIFTKVDLYFEKTDQKNHLIIFVKESWYIWPLPYLHRKHKDWEKITYGIDFRIKNFRGRNETLAAHFALGYDPSMSLSYTIPYIFRDAEISMGMGVSYSEGSNNSDAAELLYGEAFTQHFLEARMMITKRLTKYQDIGVFGGYLNVETPKYVEGISLSGDRIDRTGYLGFLYKYDSRDLSQFPTSGLYFFSEYVFKGLFNYNIDYGVFYSDIRAYTTFFDEAIVKARFMTRQVDGTNFPLYDRSFIGLSNRIRGHYHIKSEGNSAYLGSFEVNYPIIKDWNLSFKLPLLPTRLTSYRIKFYAHVFADTGLSRFRGEPFTLRNLSTGYGFGVTLLVLPYRVGRIELGFNEEGVSQFILDVGISF